MRNASGSSPRTFRTSTRQRPWRRFTARMSPRSVAPPRKKSTRTTSGLVARVCSTTSSQVAASPTTDMSGHSATMRLSPSRTTKRSSARSSVIVAGAGGGGAAGGIADRKRGGEGKRVDLGGGRIIKKKKKRNLRTSTARDREKSAMDQMEDEYQSYDGALSEGTIHTYGSARNRRIARSCQKATTRRK